MNCNEEFVVRRGPDGYPDVNYYIVAAHQLRAETTRALALQAGAWLRERVQHLLHVVHQHLHQPPLHH